MDDKKHLIAQPGENHHRACLVCQGTRLAKMARYAHAHLTQCRDCGFVFASKIPTTTELDRHYAAYGRDDYLSPITIKRYEALLDTFEHYRKNNRILDVGCGIGYFLRVAQRRGWQVYGTEFTQEAVGICQNQGITMQEGALSPDHYPPGYFDVVTSFEVIEHINNPREEMGHIHQILRQGGLFYFTTPNFNGVNRMLNKERYNVICYPEHLCYYTPNTMQRLLKGLRFEKKQVYTTGISITRAKTSRGTSDQKYISATSDDERLRLKIEKSKTLAVAKAFANWLLTMLGVGDSLKGYYIKQ